MQPVAAIATPDRSRPGESARPPVPPASRPLPAERKQQRLNFVAAAGKALEDRRLFVLLPFAIVAGLIASLGGAGQPEPVALAGVGIAAVVALPLLSRSTLGLRLLALFAAFWVGFSLLSIHGALLGTEMLSRPGYGTYEARVDEILSDGAAGRRVIVSAMVPVGSSRQLPMRRARILVGGDADLSPGDVVRGAIRFYPVPGPVIPGGFDTQFHAYFDGIGAYGSTTGSIEVVRE